MRVCSSCGRENPTDRDFCDCGEYLRWEPTGYMQAVTPADIATPAAPAADQPAAPEQPAAPQQPAAQQPGAPAAPAPPAVEPAGGNGQAGLSSGDPLAGSAAAPPPPAGAPPAGPPATAVQAAAAAAPPAPAAPAAPAPPAEVEPDMASLTLRLREGETSKEEILSMGVVPGNREQLVALVRNQSGIVDNYKLSVEGLPEDWYSIFPDTVYLVPFGTAGTYEQEVEIHLHPPKSPEAEARVWELKVLAHSRAHETLAARAPFLLGMLPYVEQETKVQPERVSGRKKGRFEVTIKNKANDVMLIGLEGSDQDSAMRYEFDPPMCELKPGETQTTKMLVRPPKQIWIGRPQESRMEVFTRVNEEAEGLLVAQEAAEEAPPEEPKKGLRSRLRGKRGKVPVYGPRVYKPQIYRPNIYAGPSGLQISKPQVRGPQVMGPQMGGMNLGLHNLRTPNLKGGGAGGAVIEGPLLPTQAVFRQKPWLPWWLAILLPLLIMAAIFLFLLMPKNTTVPKLVGLKSVSDAEQKLSDSKLKLSAKPPVEKTNADVEPGTILDQIPKAGKKVKQESEVSLVIAVGTDTVKVPDLAGKTVIDAEKLLREAKLSLGQVAPEKTPKGKIKTQIPAAGDPVKSGTPIDVFLEEAGKDGKAGGGGGDGEKDGGGGGGGEGGDLVIPAIAGADAKAYGQKASDDGLVPEQVTVFSEQPAGTLFDTNPPGGTKVKAGATVQLFVSAGFPQLAFDDEENILLINGANGKRLKAIAKDSQPEKDPTFSFDGKRVAYIGGRQVFLANRENPDEDPVALTSELDQFTNVAWAPTGTANVLAMVRAKGGDTDLCFGAIRGAGAMKVGCAADKEFAVGRTIQWDPDGKRVYVFGAKGRTGQFGMIVYKSKKPFSDDAADWGKGEFATDISKTNKGVVDMALSPNGKRLAVLADTDTPTPQLYFAKPDDLLLTDAKPLEVRGCKVAWRADSREVVVVQGTTCQEGTGQLIRVPVDEPTNVKALAATGDNPSYQPITPK